MNIDLDDLISYRDKINKMIDRFPSLPGDPFLSVDWIKVNEGDVIPNESGDGKVEVCIDVISLLLDAADDEIDERISGVKKPASPRNCKKKFSSDTYAKAVERFEEIAQTAKEISENFPATSADVWTPLVTVLPVETPTVGSGVAGLTVGTVVAPLTVGPKPFAYRKIR